MNLNSLNAEAPATSGTLSGDDNAVINLADVRAARGRAAAATRITRDSVFEGLERQVGMAGAAAELMVSGMNRFIDELEVLRNDMAIASRFCAACLDACELEDIDAMIKARDRLRIEFDERISGTRQPTAK